MFENDFLDWVFAQNRAGNAGVVIGPGDDAALVSTSGQLLITTDLLADGTHFDVATQTLRLIGRKGLAVSLSDIAAMGGTPNSAVVQLLLPRTFSQSQARELQTGILQMASEFDVDVVGGDTNRWDGKLVIGATVHGSAGRRMWKISGAIEGDRILVSGRLGGSILEHHLNFEPRCRIAQWINERFDINAATDISDSLSIDLANIAEQSGLQAQVALNKVPVSEAAHRVAETSGRTPIEHALSDGEDFELLLTCTEAVANELKSAIDIPIPLYDIGRLVSGSGLVLFDESGRCSEVQPEGYQH